MQQVFELIGVEIYLLLVSCDAVELFVWLRLLRAATLLSFDRVEPGDESLYEIQHVDAIGVDTNGEIEESNVEQGGLLFKLLDLTLSEIQQEVLLLIMSQKLNLW